MFFCRQSGGLSGQDGRRRAKCLRKSFTHAQGTGKTYHCDTAFPHELHRRVNPVLSSRQIAEDSTSATIFSDSPEHRLRRYAHVKSP